MPPVAQLKLLRSLQEDMLEQTKQVNQSAAQRAGDAMKSRLVELSAEQRKLADLGEQLVRSLQQPHQQAQPQDDANDGQ